MLSGVLSDSFYRNIHTYIEEIYINIYKKYIRVYIEEISLWVYLPQIIPTNVTLLLLME